MNQRRPAGTEHVPFGVEIVEKTLAHDGFFRLERYRLRHELFSGGWSGELTRELFERGAAAAVLPYDPVYDQVVLIEQFRIGALESPGGAWLLEVVAGIIEEGETPEEVIRREVREEAGCELIDRVPICSYLVSPGGTSERIALFCGRVDARGVGGVHGNACEGEDIRVMAVAADTAFSWVESGRIDNASTIIALQWLRLNRQGLRRTWGTPADEPG